MAVQPAEDEETFNSISNQYPEIYFQPLILTGMRLISIVRNRELGSLGLIKSYLADFRLFSTIFEYVVQMSFRTSPRGSLTAEYLVA